SSIRRQFSSVANPTLAFHFAHQPCPREIPIPHHVARRHLEDLSRFLDAEPAEEFQFDNARFPFIELFERRQRLLERDLGGSSFRPPVDRLVQIQFDCVPPWLAGAPRSGQIDEDSPHDVCRYSEKMSPILPL